MPAYIVACTIEDCSHIVLMPWEHAALDCGGDGFEDIGGVEFEGSGDEKAAYRLGVGV